MRNHLQSSSPGDSQHILPLFSRPSVSYVPRKRLGLFILTAATFGLLFNVIHSGVLDTSPNTWNRKTMHDIWEGVRKLNSSEIIDGVRKKPPGLPAGTLVSTPSPSLAPSVLSGELSLEQLHNLVDHTKGYYARDYSLGLGWNNVRYIIETAFLHAQLLNRTLVIPSYVYARSCEFDIQVCATFVEMVNRVDAIGWGQWEDLPEKKQLGWRIPIEIMLDLPQLRAAHPVITVPEYLRLHNLPPSLERTNGSWHETLYHSSSPSPSYYAIPDGKYDPGRSVVRVDRLIQANRTVDGPVHQLLLKTLGPPRSIMEMHEASMVLEGAGYDVSTEAKLEKLLDENGWATLYTFAGARDMDFIKAVSNPIKQIAPVYRLRGMIDDYDSVTEDVLHLPGEIHLHRKPGGMWFTTPAARERFSKTILESFQAIEPIRRLAEKAAAKMTRKVGGRMWMSAHMRRGDFVELGWTVNTSVQDHMKKVKSRLATGLRTLQELQTQQSSQQDLPQTNDPFFIATDERSPEAVHYLRANGAILINDLLDPDDRRIVGWPLLLTDILAIVEQAVMSKAAFFYANAASSVGGGVLNLRAIEGKDARTSFIE